jgi:hypothetical protein
LGVYLALKKANTAAIRFFVMPGHDGGGAEASQPEKA